MNWRRFLLASALVLLLVVAASALFATWRYSQQAERERQRATKLQDELNAEVARNGESLRNILGLVESAEPTGNLTGSDVGLYRARIVGRSGKYGLVFDWIGYSLDPHAPAFTNRISQRQPLRSSPLPFHVFVIQRVPAYPESELLRPMKLDDFIRVLDSKDATGTALLKSEWWVGVMGQEYAELIQIAQ